MSATPQTGAARNRRTWTLNDLVDWDAKIRARADEFGLSYYPQDVELCDHYGMLGSSMYDRMRPACDLKVLMVNSARVERNVKLLLKKSLCP